MGMPVRVVAIAALFLSLAACVKTTGGSVAMTTEPGSPIFTSTTSRSPSTSTPRTTSSPTTSESGAPAPSNATTMKCTEFTKLDDDTRLAVVKEILADDTSVFGPLGEQFAETMANTMCEFMPDQTVKEILTGPPPR